MKIRLLPKTKTILGILATVLLPTQLWLLASAQTQNSQSARQLLKLKVSEALKTDSRRIIKDIPYARYGDKNLLLDIYLPRQVSEPVPVILWIHGGAWRSGNKKLMPEPFLTNHGYAIVSINYRFTKEAIFPAQIEDVKAAVRWIRAHAEEYSFDPQRIGVAGASAGGHLAALLGTTADIEEFEGDAGNTEFSSEVQAVINFFGPSDLLHLNDPAYPTKFDPNSPTSPESMLVGGPLPERRAEARAASPISYVTQDDSPFLIVHGDRDQIVPLSQSLRLHTALEQAGVESTLHVVTGGGHGGFTDNPDIQKLVLTFFDKYLKLGAAQK